MGERELIRPETDVLPAGSVQQGEFLVMARDWRVSAFMRFSRAFALTSTTSSSVRPAAVARPVRPAAGLAFGRSEFEA